VKTIAANSALNFPLQLQHGYAGPTHFFAKTYERVNSGDGNNEAFQRCFPQRLPAAPVKQKGLSAVKDDLH
jgi:hypothetical protein